jgi:hypothetical protein
MSAYDDYKTLRNKVRKFSAISMVSLCNTKLHEIAKINLTESPDYLPWELLFLLKIAFIEGGTNGTKTATTNDVNKLLNQIKGLATHEDFFDGTITGIYKFFRIMSFQQFMFQSKLASYDISRQIVIYQDASDRLKQRFESITGMPISTYLQFFIALWVSFCMELNAQYITKNNLKEIGSDQQTDSFLDSVSLDLTGAREFLIHHYSLTPEKLLQVTEQSPLKRFPLLLADNKYYCYYPYLLQDRFTHVIYDILKENDGQDFTHEFGALFENYIYKLLGTTGLNYKIEDELKQLFPGKRVCDALIELVDIIVLIEIKGVEMHPSAQINPTNAIMTQRLQTSIVKSFEQLYDFTYTLHNTPEGRIICDGKNVYAIVVTYKEMYLSNGEDLWNEFLAEPLLNYIGRKGLNKDLLPPQNILFSSVKSFEFLTKILIHDNSVLSGLIQNVVQDNSDPSTKKHLFDMYLSKYEGKPIQFLDDVYHDIFDELISKYRGN